MFLIFLLCTLALAAPDPVAVSALPSPSPLPTPEPTPRVSPRSSPSPRPIPSLGAECRPQDYVRAESLSEWQRPLYRETALRAASQGRFDVEIEDHFRLMTSDALYGRPGSLLGRRNDELLQQYARQLEELGLRIDSKEAEKVMKAWTKAPGKNAKVTWFPVKSFARVMTGPELFRRCGVDLLEPQLSVSSDSELGAVGMICPGLLLRLGVLRFGPDVRAPIVDEALGIAGEPAASRDPMVVKLSSDQLVGLLLDLASRANTATLSPEKSRKLADQVLEGLAKIRKFKKPVDREAWLRTNKIQRCLAAH